MRLIKITIKIRTVFLIIAGMLSTWKENSYLRKIAVLFSSSMVGQAIPFVLMPLLTRIYSPEQFAEFGLYMIAVGVISAIGTLKLDQAILIPETVDEACSLVKNSALWLVLMSIIAVPMLSAVFHVKSWMLLGISLGSITAGLALLGIQWSNRLQQHKIIASHKLTLGFGVSATQLITSFSTYGLIIGKVVGDALSLIPYAFSFRKIKVKTSSISWENYWRFPVLLMPITVLNYFGNRLPLLMLFEQGFVAFSGEFEAVYRIYMAGTTLIINTLYLSFSEVLVKRAQTGVSLKDFLSKNVRYLTLSVILPAIPIILLGSWFMPLVLGEAWSQSGWFFLLLGPVMLAHLAVSPFVYVLLFKQKHGVMIGYELVIILLKFIGMYVGLHYSVFWGLGLFSLMGMLGYVMYGLKVRKEIHALDE